MTNVNESKPIELVKPAGQGTQAEGEGAEVLLSPDDAATEPAAVAAQPVLPALQSVLDRLERLERNIVQLAENTCQLIERSELLPRQVRQLGARIDDITESISQPRLRDLLGSFLLLHDLVEQMGRAAEPDTARAQNYHVLRDQIAQALRVNGIYPIAEAGCFDPAVHKAIETVACKTLDEDGEIIRIYRTGFRTERAVLRYAEVVVKHYQGPDQAV